MTTTAIIIGLVHRGVCRCGACHGAGTPRHPRESLAMQTAN
jgi:hypothetical protein